MHRFSFIHSTITKEVATYMPRKSRSRLLEVPEQSRRNVKRNEIMDFPVDYGSNVTPIRPNNRPIQAKTENQKLYLASMKLNIITVGAGPAGVGKTYLAGCHAADLLISKRVNQVIITRPAIETGASMGFLPGSLEEKFEPFLSPFRNVMIERLGKSHYEGMLKSEKILPQPLSHMRGSTFRDAFVILDEAQNCTPAEMKMFLTRIGENCTVVINGDIEQCDLNCMSGLQDAVERISRIADVGVVTFTDDDSVRSGIVREILRVYRN